MLKELLSKKKQKNVSSVYLTYEEGEIRQAKVLSKTEKEEMKTSEIPKLKSNQNENSKQNKELEELESKTILNKVFNSSNKENSGEQHNDESEAKRNVNLVKTFSLLVFFLFLGCLGWVTYHLAHYSLDNTGNYIEDVSTSSIIDYLPTAISSNIDSIISNEKKEKDNENMSQNSTSSKKKQISNSEIESLNNLIDIHNSIISEYETFRNETILFINGRSNRFVLSSYASKVNIRMSALLDDVITNYKQTDEIASSIRERLELLIATSNDVQNVDISTSKKVFNSALSEENRLSEHFQEKLVSLLNSYSIPYEEEDGHLKINY